MNLSRCQKKKKITNVNRSKSSLSEIAVTDQWTKYDIRSNKIHFTYNLRKEKIWTEFIKPLVLIFQKKKNLLPKNRQSTIKDGPTISKIKSFFPKNYNNYRLRILCHLSIIEKNILCIHIVGLSHKLSHLHKGKCPINGICTSCYSDL